MFASGRHLTTSSMPGPLRCTINAGSPGGAAAAVWPCPAVAPTAPLRRRRQAAEAGGGGTPSQDGNDSESQTPLLEAIRARGDRTHEAPFHIPGHKRGTITPAPLRALLGDALRYDLTELQGEQQQS